MDATVLDEIQGAFFGAIDAKTGWGKNEIKQVYKEAVLTVLKKYI